MDKDAYIKQLELELDLAKAKYNTIYESVRSVDRVVNNFKRRHKRAYDFIRDSYKKTQKRKVPKLLGTVTHKPNEKTPLAVIYTNQKTERLNLILDRLDEKTLTDPKIAEIVISATKLAAKKKIALRIVSRNNIVDPKLYRDFLTQKKVVPPADYSFYTDVDSRLASPIHRLEISHGDIFYDEIKGENND